MTKRIVWALLGLTLFVPTFLAIAQEHKQQVVLQVASNGTAEKLVVPRAIVVLRLLPLTGDTSKTPLGYGDLMICHPYDFKDDQQIQHSGFKCGSDVYAIVSIQYLEAK
jgi:hypothetical protein